MIGFILLLLLSGATVAVAQSAHPLTEISASSDVDALVITGGLDLFGSATRGGNGSVEWLHSNATGMTYTLGAAAFTVLDSNWAFGRGSIAFRPSDKIVVQAQASVGGGHMAGTTFPYQIYEGGLTYKTTDRVYLKINEQYLGIGEVKGHLLKPGVMLLLTQRFTADIAYAHSIAGNIDSAFLTSRFDFKTRRMGFLGGIAMGRAPAEIVNLKVGGQPRSETWKEVFVGFSIPLPWGELTVISDFPNLGATRRQTLTFGWKMPLRARSTELQ